MIKIIKIEDGIVTYVNILEQKNGVNILHQKEEYIIKAIYSRDYGMYISPFYREEVERTKEKLDLIFNI